METLFPITLSFIDSRTEYTFWSLWSAPLIVATDLRNLSALEKSFCDPTFIGAALDIMCFCLPLFSKHHHFLSTAASEKAAIVTNKEVIAVDQVCAVSSAAPDRVPIL